MLHEEGYEAWLESRRDVSPPSELAGQVMALVSQRQSAERIALAVRLALWVERSRVTRYAMCLVALLIGGTPFVFLAAVTQVFVF